jgi:tetratricopeptide (TPR) repeat protein
LSYWFTRGLQAARLGDTAAAVRALAAYITAQEELGTRLLQGPDEPTPDEQVFLARSVVLRFELLGVIRGAVDTLRSAARLEDSIPYAFGPPFVNQPSHELVGRALLDAGQATEARREYAAALARTPRRTAALLGLARAAAATGDQVAARRAYQELVTIWRQADPNQSGLAEARGTP